MTNITKVILDLCGGTGAWSRPYAEAGYDVRLVTLPDDDVRLMEAIVEPVHGILAAPPCTYFCRMRMCRGEPTSEEFAREIAVVDACLRIIVTHRPKWWALENPQGYLKRWLGEPRLRFDPCDFGHPWTKRTWLWGNFALPFQSPATPRGSWVKQHIPGRREQLTLAPTSRSSDLAITPPGFARAFFEANP